MKSPAVILYDASGVAMAVQDGVAIPVNTRGMLMAGKGGAGVARYANIKAPSTPAVAADEAVVVTVSPNTAITINTGANTRAAAFYAVFDRITVTVAAKYMATLFNTSATRKVVIHRVWVYNWQVATLSGSNRDQYMARITARTAGAAVTIRAEDTADVLSAGITADTTSTAVVEDHIVRRLRPHSDDTDWFDGKIEALIVTSSAALAYERQQFLRGITLRQNQGITIRDLGAVGSVGTVSYVFEFTDEAA